MQPSFQQNPETFKDIYVRSATGAPVPLAAFTHFAPATTALAVNHQGQFPVVTLSFNLAPGVALEVQHGQDLATQLQEAGVVAMAGPLQGHLQDVLDAAGTRRATPPRCRRGGRQGLTFGDRSSPRRGGRD